MAEHAWCRSPARDEAVRAAEDNRQGPLPTLEEAIAGVTDRRSVQPGGGGNVTGGFRTERVTLEITREAWRRATPTSPDNWAFAAREAGITFLPGESVRVVDHGNDWKAACESARIASGTIADLTRERDAAIRERDEAIRDLRSVTAERAKLEEQLESVACRAATAETALREICSLDYSLAAEMNRIAETALESSPAASGNSSAILTSSPAASGAAGTEPMAWMCEWTDHTALYDSLAIAEVDADGEIVPQPLYAAPQAAKGWLTAEEREAVAFAAKKLYELSNRQYVNGDQDAARDTAREEGFLQFLLERSSPPEVVLEDFTPDAVRNLDTKYLAGWDQCMALAKRAILAAGVKVKEVGK